MNKLKRVQFIATPEDRDPVQGTIVARRDKTRQVYVLLDNNDLASDGWYSVSSWTEVQDA